MTKTIEIEEVKSQELFDSSTNRFYYTPHIPAQQIIIAHSLISVSKWESKWHKPFISKTKLKPEELLDYIKCMTLTKNVDDDVYTYGLSKKNIDEINDYINDPMTATKLYHWEENTTKAQGQQVTSERLYMWMIQLNIPVDICEKWHLNRLLTLIDLCQSANQKGHKLTSAEMDKINKMRRKKYHSKG